MASSPPAPRNDPESAHLTSRSLGSLASAALLLLFLSGCGLFRAPEPSEAPVWTPVRFSDLPGWDRDRHAEALPALARSCALPAQRKASGWGAVCAALAASPPHDDAEARRFLETWFRPFAVDGASEGLFTGYYEAQLRGSRTRHGPYATPIWGEPDDLVTVELGLFKPDLKGQKIKGKVAGKKFVPYDARASVAAGALEGRATPLFWVDDPIGAFFLEIQGSGQIALEDGTIQRIGYVAQNGHPYAPIGRALLEDGLVERPVTMAKIRDWLHAHPDRAQAMMNRNPSVVFFQPVSFIKGAQGVPLTPYRSLAVDPKAVPLGSLLWLATEGDALAPPLRLLVMAQDTGGAIKGAVRGDLFHGAGPEAEARAGALQARGTYYLLRPIEGGGA